jgi:hypothetical protein
MTPARTLFFGALAWLSTAPALTTALDHAPLLGRAGPPMVCQEIKIGEAKTLTEDVPTGKLVAETLALLDPQTPVLARMETLRRAALAARKHTTGFSELLAALQSRLLDQEARSRPDPLAWFDAACFVATWWQLDRADAPEVGLAEGCVGYAWMRKALALAGDPADMSFAAALITHPAMHKGTHELYERHMVNAARGAAKDSLLEQNLILHCRAWDEKYDDFKGRAGADRDHGPNR